LSETYPLVSREDECGKLDKFLDHSLGNGPGQGRCLYISGGPGTGKTCCVRASIYQYWRSAPDTCVLEVNCMDLISQPNVPGVLQQLLLKLHGSRCWASGMSMQGLATLLASSLAAASPRMVIIVDEVDQLLRRKKKDIDAAACALSLETLFSLPQLPGAPAVAIIAIANAVDLLERTVCFSSSLDCSTLLFEPYSKEQLKAIVTNRINEAEGGDAAMKALGNIKVQLLVTQVAKESGDCRQVISLIEEGLSEAKAISEASRLQQQQEAISEAIAAAGESGGGDNKEEVPLQDGASASSSHETFSPDSAPVSSIPLLDTGATASASSSDVYLMDGLPPLPKRDPKKPILLKRNDPLQAIKHLPLEQQILLATLATSQREATKLSDVCKRYRELCRDLKQPDNLGSKGQVTSALSALEHRGLLAIHNHRGQQRALGKQQPIIGEATVELWVACEDLLKSVLRAKPELKKFVKAN